jgi:hypothetical protein
MKISIINGCSGVSARKSKIEMTLQQLANVFVLTARQDE